MSEEQYPVNVTTKVIGGRVTERLLTVRAATVDEAEILHRHLAASVEAWDEPPPGEEVAGPPPPGPPGAPMTQPGAQISGGMQTNKKQIQLQRRAQCADPNCGAQLPVGATVWWYPRSGKIFGIGCHGKQG